ncbi:receptor-type tyrosine-protein phosphatase T-like isoform X2 [Asterias rubens]|uniref:receptor-type tyrosine-protein phosphatase T-like isoform X2 n=1 Tax=Asterias rubens TaxID=7604 RepID=UPI001455873A|nr:receptor-type tyrosine-protein phosphatase T-like isoform X2 [Asterias rubens]
MMSSLFYSLELSVITCVCLYLHTGVAVELDGSLTSQSTTYNNLRIYMPDKAVDGDRDTTAISAHTANPWWKVDLGDTYCLKSVTLTNRVEFDGRNNFNAVLRVGLSSQHLQNAMIGSPVTWAQAAQALTFDLAVDPIAIARYVSFDIPTDAGATTNLALAEVKVEEITESGSGDMVLGALSLSGNPSRQSSTQNLVHSASKALDGDWSGSTFTLTVGELNPWWKVDLVAEYCLGKIRVRNRESTESIEIRLVGAVVRAGLSDVVIDNPACGSPVTRQQALSDAWIEFTCDPPRFSRYVSVDIPGIAILSLAEVQVLYSEVSTCMGIDFTLVTNIPRIGQTEDNEAAITAYKGCSDLTASVSFGRQLITGGTNTGLPAGSSEVDDPKLGRAARSLTLPQAGGIDRVGVFYSEVSKSGRRTRIQTILLPKNDGDVYILPEQRTLTVNIGELVTLTMVSYNAQTNVNVRWKHHGDTIDRWNNQLTVSIPSVVQPDEGIYSCFMDGQEDQQRHGIMRLIVRACPSVMWGPMCLSACHQCYNGGICDDRTGTCICAPGFSGNNCEKVHGRHVFGKDAQYGCSDSHDPHHNACQGHLFCLLDPYGCSCAAGYMGLDCMQECLDGKYGADCKQTCHCQDQGACLKDTGECNNGGGGGCAAKYFGSNCQCSNENPVLGLGVISHGPQSLTITWEHDPCVSRYSLTYELTNRGQCGEITSPVKTSVSDPSSGQTSQYLSSLEPFSTYTVYIAPIYQSNIIGPESSASAITLDVADPDPVALSVTAASPSQILVAWDPICGAIDYKVDYVLKTLDNCESYEITPSSVYTSPPDCPCTSTSVSISGLHAYSTYVIRVQVQVVGSSSYGREETVEVTTDMSEPTAAPTDVRVLSISETSLSFSWSEPPCGGRGGIITGYSYKLTQVGADNEEGPTITSNTAVTISGLIPYTDYSFQVAASTNMGTGPFSSSLNTRTPEGVPPAPMDFNVKSADESSITVEWKEPDPPHGIILNYDISYWPSMEVETSATEETDIGVTSLSYRIEGLLTNVNYSIKVRATTSAGSGVWSVAVTYTTEIGVPGPVENLRSTDQTDMSITLEWDPPMNPNGQIMNYIVEYRAVEKRHQADFTADTAYMNKELGNELQATITNLEPTTRYKLKISTQNQMFTSDAAVLEVFTKPLENPPSPPVPSSNPSDATDTTVTINLSRVPDDVYITSYVIHVKKTESKRKREALDPIHYKDSQDDYIAAELSKEMVQDSFVVGDDRMYGGYLNAPLDKGATYDIRVGAVSSGNGTDVTVTYSDPLSATVEATVEATSSSPIGGIVGGVLAFIIVIVVIIIGMIMYRRKRNDGGSKQHFETDGDIHLEPTNNCLADASSVCIEPAVRDRPTPTGTPSPTRNPTEQPPEPKQLPFTNPPPVRIEELEEYIQMKKSAAADEGFEADYKTLPEGQLHSWTVARKPENKAKNRYANVIAYDYCRVVLEPLENKPHSDYINACYIDGYRAEDAYIASQGPNKESIKDFWRMMWQLNVDKIIMLTNPIEDGKMKCLKYWTDNGSAEYTGIQVTTVREDVYLDYTVRLFDICEAGKQESTRRVTQFHYTTWPDMKPPEYPTSLLNFLRVVNTTKNIGRTVVHCSAGVGRTGTYITLDAMLEQMKEEGQIEVLSFINQMRHRRIKSVQTVEQYKFLYDAILEAYLSNDTTYHVTEYRRKLTALKKSGMEQQFKTLRKLCAESTPKPNSSGKLPENVSKNRFPEFIPTDRSRPYLTTLTSEEDTNYINGTYLPGYRKRNRYIATQMPTPNTIGDIWRLVYDHKSTCIVMLNQFDKDDETMVQYWPEAGPMEFGPLVVELLETNEYTGVIGHSFTLKKKNSKLDPPRTVCQFQYLDWPCDQDVPSSLDGLLTLFQLTEQWNKTEEGPIVVHCIDGLGRSAAFCALITLMDKFNEEKVVNVFQEALRFRMVNSNMLYSVEHYAMCYNVIQAYMNSLAENAIYENLNS